MGWTPRKNSDGFHEVKLPGRTAVSVESVRAEECLAYARRRGATDVALIPLHGFSGVETDFLRGQTWIKGVSIVNVRRLELSGLASIAGSIEYLATGELEEPLRLSSFPRLVELRAQWHPALELDGPEGLKRLALWGYRPASEDLSGLSTLASLAALELVHAQIVSLDGIERLHALREIEVTASRLERIAALAYAGRGGVERVEFDRCKKIAEFAAIGQLRALRVLRLLKCGTVALDFPCDLPRIEQVVLSGTRVSGDVPAAVRAAAYYEE
jgi:hypothetical protein